MRKAFTKKDLEDFLDKMGGRLKKPLSVYMLGGGAMVFRDQKVATKDLDLVFLEADGCDAFSSHLKEMGFSLKKFDGLEPEYVEMEADSIWMDKNDFRLDLFVRWVCKKLELTPGMVKRSKLLGNYAHLSIYLVSDEDVVLFKSITDRDADLNDMAAVIRSSGVDWAIILAECKAQSNDRPWHGAVYNKFVDMKERHGIDAPILPELDVLAKKDLVKSGYDLRIAKGLSRKKALEELRKLGFTKKELEIL